MNSGLRRLCAGAVAGVLAYGTLLVPGAPGAVAEEGSGARCLDASAEVTVEGRRLDREEPREILERGGLADARPGFARDLCRARDLTSARRAVDRHAGALWRTAVGRAKHAGPGRNGTPRAGGLPGGDDRPLYWARL